MKSNNIDMPSVQGFGDEWERFDQSSLSPKERQEIFDSYFSIFPWKNLNQKSVGFDLGCGSGRWAQLVAPRIGRLHCIDPSTALEVAKQNLVDNPNCEFHHASVDTIPLVDGSMDFGYSLGVLHHTPNTQSALNACVKKLKPGAPFLVYMYYSFDNRPLWFRGIWKLSELARLFISRLPYWLRYCVSQVIAAFVYVPLAKSAYLLEKTGLDVSNFPLSFYRKRSFYTMRTDALDRFGTRLEKRFTKKQIQEMMENAGLNNIVFSRNVPHWCAVGTRRNIKEVKN